MKNTILPLLTLVVLVALGGSGLLAQEYTPAFFHAVGTPTHGVKIKTKIPFAHPGSMPTIIIEGYNYSDAKTIGVMLNFYIHLGLFKKYSATSHGSHVPTIKLAEENGFVVIFLEDKIYFERFMVRAFGQGIGNDNDPTTYENWTVVDEPLSGDHDHLANVPMKARQWDLHNNNFFHLDGNLGIGTSNVRGRLEIKHTGFTPSQSTTRNLDHIFLSSSDIQNGMNFGGITWSALGRRRASIAAVKETNQTANVNDIGLSFFTKANGAGNLVESLRISHEGNVGIGVSNPTDKLTVDGKITSEEVKVEIVNGPDYVFEADYALRTLKDVEAYIKAYGHLPEVPSAVEMEAEGVNVGEMNMLLLKKVEELTLYTLEQERKLENMQDQLDEVFKLLKKRIVSN